MVVHMRRTRRIFVAPWVPGPRGDTKLTVPPPPGGEVGGLQGISKGYSHRIATTPHWQRMANSTLAERFKENETRYPFSSTRAGEYDIRYLAVPYHDRLSRKPLLEIGEAHEIPRLQVPVIFLVDLFDTDEQRMIGRKLETVYVASDFMREELLPQRFAIFATPEAYELLGLDVVDHKIHAQIPKNQKEYQKLMEKQSWDEEPWRYTIESLFRKYEAGPTELLDVAEEWTGEEDVAVTSSGGTSATTASRKGPIKQRKARKVKLF